MKRLFLAAAIALSFTVCSAETLNVVWGMIDHNGDEFTSQMLENVTFSARISNFGSGYNSSVSSETSPGNSVEVYEGERGVCIIDFSNFTDWEWRSGDELKLLVKNHNPETKAFWREAYASWIIPQNADGLHQFGFEDLGIAGSGDPLSSWADFYYPERNIYIGLVDHNGDIFDFTEPPYNRVTFKAWITGRENDTIDQNSSKSGYIQYEELASAIRFDLYDFDTLPSAGETFNLEVIHDSFGLGYYDLHFEGVLGDIQDDEDVIVGLDAWYGTGSGGGSAWAVDNFVEEKFMVTWGMIDHDDNEFTDDNIGGAYFSAWLEKGTGPDIVVGEISYHDDPGNSVEMYHGVRGVCIIDMSNFTAFDEGNIVRIRIGKPYGCVISGEASWKIPDPIVFNSFFEEDTVLLGFEDFGLPGSGLPIAVYFDTSIGENSGIPVATELFQNYPNPFNPVTQIRFALAKTSDVKLSVYNISGQRVAELASGVKNAGHHAVDFDGSRLNSGIYYYTLEVDGKAMTKRMVLTK